MSTWSLIKPSLAYLPHYTAALERGWSPDNIRKDEAIREQLAQIADDPERFVAEQDDPDALGPPIKLPDGSVAQRLPGLHRWLWDGEFCGVIGLRWQPGTSALPPHVLGHIGFSVVAWKRGRGYAKAALAQLLPEARARGLTSVELTTDPGNIASQRVILFNRGRLVERFRKSDAYGGAEAFRFRIDL
jgi:predicted acetyltransferase